MADKIIVRYIVTPAEFERAQQTMQASEAAGHSAYVCAENALASIGIVPKPGTEIILEVDPTVERADG
jgi:hypothetical protein